MNIERIRIGAFGGLADREFSFGSGVNILEGENESGKTTIAAFLRFLFYGCSGEEERGRYFTLLPEGADRVLSGWLDCSCTEKDGNVRSYRISRQLSETEDSLVGSSEIIDLAANTRIFSDAEPWEVFFGVPADVFVSTAFVRQYSAAESADTFPSGTGVGSGAVRSAMENILVSADAEMNPARTAAALDAQREALFCAETNSGEIADLERQREALADHIAAASAAAAEKRSRQETEDIFRNAENGAENSRESAQEEENDEEMRSISAKIEDCRARIAENDARSAQLEIVRKKCEEYKNLDRIGELRTLRDKKAAVQRRAQALCETMFRSDEVPDEHFADELRRAAAEMTKARSAADKAEGELRKLSYSARHDALWAQFIARVSQDGGTEVIRRRISAASKSRTRAALLGGISFLLTVFSLAAAVFFLIIQANVRGLFVLLTFILGALSLIFFLSHSSADRNLRAALKRYGCKNEESLYHFLNEYGSSQAQMKSNTEKRNAASAALKESTLMYEMAADDAAELLRRLQPKGAPPISAGRLNPDLVRRASEQLDKTVAEIASLDARAEAYEEQIQATAQVLGSDDEAVLLEKQESCRRVFAGKEAKDINMESILRELDFNLKANKALVEKISLLGQQLDMRRAALHAAAERQPAPAVSYSAADPDVCAHLAAELDAELYDKRRTYQALRLAASAMRRAGAAIKGRLAPQLMKNAGAFLRVLSDGQYSDLVLDGSLSVRVPAEEGGNAFPVAYMSAGTQDLAFLCLRIALALQLYERDLPPLLFDDAFTGLDDKHLVRVIRLLASVSSANGAQVFVLTCQKRENRIAAELLKDYTYIGL